MKSKITISLDETILSRIDKSVQDNQGKNRSYIIEKILRERYGDFSDITAIIFAHDKKWDNRNYPFDIPKSLLDINKKSIIRSQIDIFSKTGITHYVITIPEGTSELFKKELYKYFPFLNFIFLELDYKTLTGVALREALKTDKCNNKLIISNGDIYYGSLDLEKYYKYHNEQESDFSLCLKFVLNPEQLGNVQIHGNKIINFVEKPDASEMNLTNSGLYITTKKFLDNNYFGDYLEKDFLPKLPELCNNIGYIYPGQWEHIQNDSAYERVNGWLL